MSQSFSSSNVQRTVSQVSARSVGVSSVEVTSRIAEDLILLLSGSGSASGSVNVSNGSVSAYAVSSSASASVSGAILSQIELAILRSTNPIEVSESEEITVIGQRGLWVNQAEVNAWKGDIAISEYLIHEDENPEIITKKVAQQVEYIQELAVRYLRPPTPPAPGEIVITMEANIATGPAPPLIIRQQPARAETPEPLIIREAPPQPPVPVGAKRITISGKRLPPPPRKVVIERLAQLPSKPQNVIIERWLPYGEVKRRVIFNKSTAADPVVANPRNVIVQWEAPEVEVKQEIKYLGVIKANPAEYVEKYGDSLKLSSALPEFVLNIKTPGDVGTLAAEYRAKSLIELEGELEGFQYVDLDKEGLGEYRAYLAGLGIKDLGAAAAAASSAAVSASAAAASVSASAAASASASVFAASASASAVTGSAAAASAASAAASEAASKIFEMIDVNHNGSISVNEAERIVLKINSRLQRSYGENDVKAFFAVMCDGKPSITKAQFVTAFDRLSR